tara:strand:+ start:18768 stop:19124 length:357 start_codon:yes stop_codon:yes gene_type:complete
MENQLSLILEVAEAGESSPELEQALDDVLQDEEISNLKKNLFLESVRSAFGLSRGGRKFKPSEEAWSWINEVATNSPFSFEECCKELAADPELDFAGLDPERLLGLLRWNRRRMLGEH